jgi:hypothetical protein
MSTNHLRQALLTAPSICPLKTLGNLYDFFMSATLSFQENAHGAKASTSRTGYGFRGSVSDGARYAYLIAPNSCAGRR